MKQLTIIFLLAWVSVTFAGNENEDKTGMAFLKVGVDARAAGMGEAYTAATNDAYATFWNPAGLLSATQSNVVLMHNRWLFDVNSEFGAVQFRKQKSSFAFHVYSFNVGAIEVRNIPSTDPLEETSAHYASLGFSYARQLGNTLDVGVTVKYLYEKIFIHSAGGYGLDLGVNYRGLGQNLLLAAALQNLGSMGELDREATALPALLRAGGRYQFANPVGPLELLVAGDAVLPFEENLRVHLGLEAGLWQQLMLRAGYMNGYESRNVSFGIGVRKSAFHFDYSYTPFSDDLGSGQRFSLYLAI